MHHRDGESDAEHMSNDTDSPMATAAALGKHESNVQQAFYDAGTDDSVSETILEAMEAISGRPAGELGVCLYDSVDPDALNDLLRPTGDRNRRPAGRVKFAVGPYAVTVHADGIVFVRKTG